LVRQKRSKFCITAASPPVERPSEFFSSSIAAMWGAKALL